MKPAALFFLSLFAGLSVMPAARSLAQQRSFGAPAVILAYPESHGVIKDQSQLATIVISPACALSIDGTPVIGVRGKEIPSIRTANYNRARMRAIDLLPGSYTLTVEYDDQSKGYKTREPLETEVVLKGGEFYRLDVKVIRHSGGVDGRIDIRSDYLNDNNKQVIIWTRNDFF